MKKSMLSIVAIAIIAVTLVAPAFAADMGGAGGTPQTTYNADDLVKLGGTYEAFSQEATHNAGTVDANLMVGDADSNVLGIPDGTRELGISNTGTGAGGSLVHTPSSDVTNGNVKNHTAGMVATDRADLNTGNVTASTWIKNLNITGGTKDLTASISNSSNGTAVHVVTSAPPVVQQ